MGVPDNSLLDLIEKVRSWISWGTSDLNSLSSQFEMADNKGKMCSQCELTFKETSLQYYCQSCHRIFCANCVWGYGSRDALSGDTKSSVDADVVDIISCKFCSEIRIRNERGRKYSDKIYPAESPRQSPEPKSPCFSGERSDGYSPDAMRSSVTSFNGHPSPVSVCLSPNRSDEEEAEDSATTFFSTSGEFCNGTLDVDSVALVLDMTFTVLSQLDLVLLTAPLGFILVPIELGNLYRRGKGEPLGLVMTVTLIMIQWLF